MTTSQSSLRDRYRGQRVFLTGASGLLGQVVLEKILRSLPEIEHVYLLLRPRGRLSAHERLPEIFSTPLFQRLRAERPDFDAWWPTKATAVPGALGSPHLGLWPDAWRDLSQKITAVIHSGAVASFDEPIDRVLEVNTVGTMDVLELARAAGNAPMVHVSTCYVCGKVDGTHAEELIPWGHTPLTLSSGAAPTFDPEVELQSLLRQSRRLRDEVAAGVHDSVVKRGLPDTPLSEDRLDVLRREYADDRLGRMGARIANRLGWPDPYPMSKALGEQLITRRRGAVPLAIVRPAILGSTVAEPQPGWLTGLRMADPMIVAGGRGLLHIFPGDASAILDLVPTDLAAHAVLIALPERGASQDPPVYQVAGSARNPLTLGEFVRIGHAAAMVDPFYDQNGERIEPANVQLVSYPRFRRMLSHERRRVALKLAVLDELEMAEKSRPLRARLRVLRHAHLLGRWYAPYSTRHFRFASERSDRLGDSLAADEREVFPTDVSHVDWPRYLADVHIPAVRRLSGGSKEASEGGAARRRIGGG